MKIEVGNKVSTIGGKTGIVRFVGKTKFADGFWVGIELEKPGNSSVFVC
jgi:CAP-Gly domain-containing linker protein 3/4